MTDLVKRQKDDLSVDELKFITETKGKCPDCKIGDLKEGQKGNSSQNYFCSNDTCRSGFSLDFSFCFDFDHLVWGHRISKRKEKKRSN
ncbi:MAG: hypothetical protein WDZ80_06150 [Candidatus Paceibacterota bacterium]